MINKYLENNIDTLNLNQNITYLLKDHDILKIKDLWIQFKRNKFNC